MKRVFLSLIFTLLVTVAFSQQAQFIDYSDTIEFKFSFLKLGANIALSFAGLVGFALFSVRNHLKDFEFQIFWNENKIFWLWSIMAQLLYSTVMAFYPDLEQFLAGRLIEIVLTTFNASWEIPKNLIVTIVYLCGTWLMSLLVNRNVKAENKIGTKKQASNG